MIPANASARKGPEGKYPLHFLVWHNRHRELEKEVCAGQVRAPSGRRGDPAAGTPPRGMGRGRGAGCPASPASLRRFFVRTAAFVLVDQERVMGTAPARSPPAGTGYPHVSWTL